MYILLTILLSAFDSKTPVPKYSSKKNLKGQCQNKIAKYCFSILSDLKEVGSSFEHLLPFNSYDPPLRIKLAFFSVKREE